MQTSEVSLMELSDEDLLLVSGGLITLVGPVRFGGTVGGGNTVVSSAGVITATASATGASFGGVTTGNVTIT